MEERGPGKGFCMSFFICSRLAAAWVCMSDRALVTHDLVDGTQADRGRDAGHGRGDDAGDAGPAHPVLEMVKNYSRRCVQCVLSSSVVLQSRKQGAAMPRGEGSLVIGNSSGNDYGLMTKDVENSSLAARARRGQLEGSQRLPEHGGSGRHPADAQGSASS